MDAELLDGIAGIIEAALPPGNIEEYMAWYKKSTQPMIARRRVWPNKVQTELSIYDDAIVIEIIQSPVKGKGFGTAIMKELVKAADKFGVKMLLEPVPYQAPSGKDEEYTEKLIAWYKKIGFVEHPELGPDQMIREPK